MLALVVLPLLLAGRPSLLASAFGLYLVVPSSSLAAPLVTVHHVNPLYVVVSIL